MSKLNNKVAVVTGGSSGIGFATAQQFIADGAHVVITGRNQETQDTAVAKLGDWATGIHGDVANLEDLDRLFEQVQKQFGRVDVLFANAGIAPLGPFETVTEEHFDNLFNFNVRGLFFTLQKALLDPSRKSGGALHRLHCFCLEFDGACEVQRRVPTDWIIEPIDVPGYGSFSLAS